MFASDNTGLISVDSLWPLQVQSILYEMFRYRICKKMETHKLGNNFTHKLPGNNIRVEIDVSRFLFPAPAFLSLTYTDNSNKLIKNKTLACSKSETVH